MRLLVFACLAAGLLQAGGAGSLFREAQQAERSGDVVRAYLLYAEAAALEPGNPSYWARAQALRTRASLLAKPMPLTPSSAGEPVSGEAGDEPDPILPEELAEARRLLPPVRLQADPVRRSFDLRGDSRELFEQVAQAYGLDVIFDGDYQPLPSLRFRLHDAGHREALRTLEAATASFLVPVSERLGLVARDTQQKRQEMESTVSVVVPIPHPVSLQEAQELARSVQQLMEIQRLTVDSQRRLVLIRDRVSKVEPARLIYEQLLHHRPQVAVEVEFLEVTESSSLSYGLRLPTSSPVAWLSRIWNSAPSIPSGFTRFATLGAGKSFLGFGISDAELFASMARSSTRRLLKTEVRSVDGQPVSFHIGDKYPILTGGYFGALETGGQIYTPPPTFNFEDLGLVLKITPRVHGMEEVTLEVEAEFKVLTGQTLNGIPVIANRKFASGARLRNGEWAILAGLLRASEARTLTGLAGLAQLPLLGALFRQDDRSQDSGQSLLVLKPKLLSLPATEAQTVTLYTGTETRPLSPL